MKPKTTSSRLVKKITLATLVLAVLPAMAATQIVSQLPSSSPIFTVGGGSSYDPIVTPDGRYVLFASTSANLVAGPGGLQMPSAVPAPMNVFLRDRQTGVTTLISVNAAGTAGGNADSFPDAISTNGQFAVFESAASNLVAGDANSAGDIFVRDTVSNITTLVSVSTNGSPGNGASRHAAITPDGRYVAFDSAANNLVAGDNNGIPDVFVRDLQLGVTTLASPGAQKYTSASTPLTDGSASEWPIISADGRYVAFFSTAIRLVSNVTSAGELYVRDLVQGSTAWVSTNAHLFNSSAVSANYAMSADGQWIAYQATGGTLAGLVFRYNVATGTSDFICVNGSVAASLDNDGRNIDISADGRFVVFTMTNSFVPYFSGGAYIRLWDAQSNAISLINGVTNAAHCDFPRLDQTGRYVAFTSDEASLTTNSDGACHIYLRDTSTGAIQLVDQGINSAFPIAYIMTPFHLSANGNAVAFDCPDGALGANPFKFDAFLRDFSSNTTEIISVPAPTLPSDTPLNSSGLTAFSISSNGQFVAFTSQSDGIVSGDTNGCQDVFVHDFSTGSNTLVSVSVSGLSAGNGNSSEPAISADGRYVAFSSFATNLVTNDINNYFDIFLRDLQAGSTELISKNFLGFGNASGSSFTPQISADGHRLLFVSLANNLTTNTGVTGSNLFWRDLQAGVTYPITTTGGVTVAAMTPDGSNVLFATGAQLSLWNAGAHSTTNVTTASSAVIDLAIGADAHRAAFVAGGFCYAADLLANTNWLLAMVKITSHTHCQFTGDSRFLACLALDNTSVTNMNQVCLYDFQNATSNLVSHSYNSTAADGNGPSDSPAISPDGRLVAYRSAAANLVPGDTNGVPGIFLYDRLTGGTTLISASMFGVCAANSRSLSPAFSADGRTLFFESWASDLAQGDFNDSCDVFAISLSINGSTNPTNAIPSPSFTGIVPAAAGGQFSTGQPLTLTWSSAPGAGCQVQYKNNLTDPEWLPLNSPVTAIGCQGFITDSSPDPVQRYYRIISF